MTPDRVIALTALLEQPDPEDLPPRTHVLTQAGDPDRFVLLSWLPNVSTAYRLRELDEARTG